MEIRRNPTRSVAIGSITIGGGHPIAVQSMTATSTRDVAATARQVNRLADAGADVVRIAVDSRADAEALAEIRKRTTANLSVDLQENYRLAEEVAPHVDKIRYNPGHLYHHERDKPWQDKVRYLVDVARQHDCAPARRRQLRQCRSGQTRRKYDPDDAITPMLESAREHCELLDALGFTRYCVSLKDSDPVQVVEVNQRFAAARPDVPLHLGVTEAGLPPDGITKTRLAFEQLIGRGIGDTIRVSLTVPNDQKQQEIAAGRQILEDIRAGRMLNAVPLAPRPPEHHLVPELLARRERSVRRTGAAGPGLTRYAQDHADHDRRHGVPRERARRDRRRRPGAVVRPQPRELKARQPVARRLALRSDPRPTQGRIGPTDRSTQTPVVACGCFRCRTRLQAAGGRLQAGTWGLEPAASRLRPPLPFDVGCSDVPMFDGPPRIWHGSPCSTMSTLQAPGSRLQPQPAASPRRKLQPPTSAPPPGSRTAAVQPSSASSLQPPAWPPRNRHSTRKRFLLES